MNETDRCAERDLLNRGWTMGLLWCLPAGLILVTGFLVDTQWVIAVSWTLSLLVMGTACIVNARDCRRLHCYFTGPFFLSMAVVSLLFGLSVLPLGTDGWSYIGLALLVGGMLLCVLPELFWGRYRG